MLEDIMIFSTAVCHDVLIKFANWLIIMENNTAVVIPVNTDVVSMSS